MYLGIAIFIVIAGTVAIIYTILGAISGRNMAIGLILAGSILVVQVVGLAYSAVKDPPPAKETPTEESQSPSPEPSAAAVLFLTG